VSRKLHFRQYVGKGHSVQLSTIRIKHGSRISMRVSGYLKLNEKAGAKKRQLRKTIYHILWKQSFAMVKGLKY